MKKFFGEFKTFITRGNVMDMAVGVIIGGAFSAIVTALTNHILMPIINWILLLITGGNGLDAIYTYLKKVPDGEGGIDLAQSIYIDWGAFITAIINFILIALVLFLIIRTINKVAEANKKLKEGAIKGKISKEDKKELKEKGISLKDKEKVAAYFAEKKAAEEAAKAEAEAKAKAEAEEAQKHTTEGLLEQIKALLEKQGK